MGKHGAYLAIFGLPLGLVIAGVQAWFWPVPGVEIDRIYGGQVCIGCICLLSGLHLTTEDVKKANKRPRPFLWGLISILLVSPLAAIELLNLVPLDTDATPTPATPTPGTTVDWQPARNTSNANSSCSYVKSTKGQLGPQEFVYGLQIFGAGPCATSAAFVFTMLLDGDLTMAGMVTAVPTVAAFWYYPALLNWRSNIGLEARFTGASWGFLITEQILIVVVPFLFGFILGSNLPACTEFSTFIRKHRAAFQNAFNTFLVLLAWMVVSKISEEKVYSCVDTSALLYLIGMAVLLHLLFLIINSLAARMVCLKKEDALAVVLMCSLKILPTSLVLISLLDTDRGARDLMSLACRFAYLVQLMLSALLSLLLLKCGRGSAMLENSTSPQSASEEDMPDNDTFALHLIMHLAQALAENDADEEQAEGETSAGLLY
ncbi:uncharacterized protein LOC135815694 [Sycon ciliatum]|uniref:uncharacterized protein LOC135815694 n=1 Tax=Sycon ciliatum TaxID=27933 RepID=UPI0031F64D9A